MSSFIDRIRSGAGKAAFEADKLRRVNAVQSEIKGLRDDVRQALNRVGDVAYELYRREQIDQPELREACRQVQALQEQVAAKEQELEQIRQEEYIEEIPAVQYGRICPHGHGPIPPENNFCQECGARAVEAPQPAAIANRFCQNCGEPLGPQARFCASCGTAAPQAKTEPSPSYCQECGTKLLPSAVFCSECGTPVASNERTDVEPATTETLSGTVTNGVEVPERESDIGQNKPAKARESGAVTSEVERKTVTPSMPRVEEEQANSGEAAIFTDDEELAPHEEAVNVAQEATLTPDSDDVEAEAAGRSEVDGDLCPACETPRLPEAIFCAECGYRFAGDGTGDVGQIGGHMETCPVCNMPPLPEALFCSECGHSFVSTAQ